MWVGVSLLLFAPVIAACWAIYTRPQRGVLILLALAPFDGLLLLVPHPSIIDGWTEIMLVVVVGLAALRAPQPTVHPDPRRIPSWAWASLALAVFAAARTIPDPSTQAALGFRLAFAFTLVTLVIWRHPLDRSDRDTLVTIFMVTGFIAAVVGLGQQVVGHAALNRIGYEYNEVIRTTNGLLRSFSTFNQPFPFAFHTMVTVLVGLPVAFADRSRRRNRWFLVATPILAAGMSTALVRASLVGLVVGLAVLAILRVRVLVHAFLAIAVVALLVWPVAGSAIVSSSSVDDRTTGWTQASDQILANPFGAGVGTVGAAAEKALEEASSRPSFPSTDDDAYQPDNYYMLVLLELGPIGLWLFLTMLVAAWSHARRLSRATTGEDSALALGVAASIAGAGAAALAATYWEIFPVDLYFWTLLGVLTCIEHDSASTPLRLDPKVPESRPMFASSSMRSIRGSTPN